MQTTQQTTQPKNDPRLSEALPPAFTDCGEEQIGDALVWWGQLSGRDKPQASLSLNPTQVYELRQAANGLTAVADLLRILTESEASQATPRIVGGLVSAACSLAWQIECELSRG